MRRYLRIWLEFLKMSWMSDSEYRLNFVVRFIGEIFWYVAQLSVFEVLYLHTDSINGWTIADVRIFMGTLFFSDVIYMIFFQENLDNLSRLVRRGELDLYLVKPINSQFMVSCRKVAVVNFSNLLLVLSYLIWAVVKAGYSVGPIQIVAFVLLVLVGVTVSYCMRLMFGMLVMIIHEASNIQFIWYQIYRLGTRPDILYPSFLRYLIFTALPVAFIASVPSRILIEGMSWRWLGIGLSVASGLILLTSFLWHRTLRHYASASS